MCNIQKNDNDDTGNTVLIKCLITSWACKIFHVTVFWIMTPCNMWQDINVLEGHATSIFTLKMEAA